MSDIDDIIDIENKVKELFNKGIKLDLSINDLMEKNSTYVSNGSSLNGTLQNGSSSNRIHTSNESSLNKTTSNGIHTSNGSSLNGTSSNESSLNGSSSNGTSLSGSSLNETLQNGTHTLNTQPIINAKPVSYFENQLLTHSVSLAGSSEQSVQPSLVQPNQPVQPSLIQEQPVKFTPSIQQNSVSVQPSLVQPNQSVQEQSVQSLPVQPNQSVQEQPVKFTQPIQPDQSAPAQYTVEQNNTPKLVVNEEMINKDSLNNWLNKNNDSELFDKISGLIYGCAIGDNLGLQVEGKTLEHISMYIRDGIRDQPTINSKGIDKGDWTEDTDQLILLMDVLTENGLVFDYYLYAKKLYTWKKKGFYEIGDQTAQGLDSFLSHVLSKESFLESPVKAATDAYKDIGNNTAPNSSLVRSGILSCIPTWQKAIIQQSAITCIDNRCIYACWLFTNVCRNILQGNIPDNNALFNNSDIFLPKQNQKHKIEFAKYKKIYCMPSDKMLHELKLGDQNDMRYVFKTLGCVFYALACITENLVRTTTDFKNILLNIVNQGGDTDNNAAVAGQVLGAYLGYQKLPKEWLYTLINKEWLDKKIIKFFTAIEKQ